MRLTSVLILLALGPGAAFAQQGVTPAAPSPRDGAGTATVNVQLPAADVELWVNGEKATGSGTARQLTTPALKPRESVTYNLRARWSRKGRRLLETDHVTVYPGDRVTVLFGQHPRLEGPPEVVPREYKGP